MPFSLLLGLLFFCGSVFAAPSPAARVVSVNGTATVNEHALKPGDTVLSGEEIHTRERSGVKLLLSDRSIIDIGPSTTFKVSEVRVAPSGERNVDLSLDTGSVRASVTKKLDKKSKFFIRTKSSVMAVRGTEVSATWELVGNEANQQITVFEGKVVLTHDRAGNLPPVTMGPGHQHTLVGTFEGNRFVPSDKGATGTTGLQTLTQTQLTDVMSVVRVHDKTFLQNVAIGEGGQSRTPFEGRATLGTLTAAVTTARANRGPASETTVKDIPAAMGQDVGNGAGGIPGYAGIPGTGIGGPNGSDGPGRGTGRGAPQVLVNLNVVLSPAP